MTKLIEKEDGYYSVVTEIEIKSAKPYAYSIKKNGGGFRYDNKIRHEWLENKPDEYWAGLAQVMNVEKMSFSILEDMIAEKSPLFHITWDVEVKVKTEEKTLTKTVIVNLDYDIKPEIHHLPLKVGDEVKVRDFDTGGGGMGYRDYDY